MRNCLTTLTVFFCCGGSMAGDDVVDRLAGHLGKTPALVVFVCHGTDQDVATVASLVDQTPWKLFCRSSKPGGLERLRGWARDREVLGSRVSVVDDESMSLCLASEMADAVVLAPGVDFALYEVETMRVLRPGGLGVSPGKLIVKPKRSAVDEWRHPYHEPDNNVVSRDSVARLPGELRFQTHPVFAAMPNQSLFAGGRIFFFSGHIAFHEREEPLLNTLTVLNAYNGLLLWTRPLHPDFVVHNIAKFATDREVVFAEGETLWMLDAATGKELGKFAAPESAIAAGDTDWKWVVQQGHRLWAALGPPDGRVAPYRLKRQMGHWPWDVANDRYSSITNKFGEARTLAAFAYPEMKPLWAVRESEPFDARTLCMDRDRIFALSPERYMVVRSAETGSPLWRHAAGDGARALDVVGAAAKHQGWGIGWSTYCCARAANGVVCIAGPPYRKTVCVGMEQGDLLWASDSPSPHPFFLGDALYVMPRVAAPAASCQVVEPRTGKLLDQFSLGVIGSCTRLTVTPSQFFYRPGGGEGRTVFVDLATRALAEYEGIVRPGCFDGVVPAYGRLYWMPLACDCWQVHGTFSMAPRAPVLERRTPPPAPAPWSAPRSEQAAAKGDWPMFRANAAGTATVAANVPRNARMLWERRVPGGTLTAPTSANGRVYVGGVDGTVTALSQANGELLWQVSTQAAVNFPPAYWNGRVVFGSCDGVLYCVDAMDGRILGKRELAPEKRFVNIMDRLVSAWPLGGGVVLDEKGVVFAAAGSTAADGTVVAALDAAIGRLRWRQTYSLDRKDPMLSFGVQANILLDGDTLFVNGGAPVGIVALDATTGASPRVAAKLEAGMEMFLEPDGNPICRGPELYGHVAARTTIFKRHQGRAYFPLADRRVALVDGRLFCARDAKTLDLIVDLMNQDPNTGGRLTTEPRDVMQVPLNDAILWAGKSADVCGLAVATDGVIALCGDRVEAISPEGELWWTVPLPAAPVRWGLALSNKACHVTLRDGRVLCLGSTSATGGKPGS